MKIPENGLSFDPPLRVFNMSGGVSCLVANSGLCWLMLPASYSVFWSEIDSNTHQIAEIKTLRKICFQRFNHADELNDPFEQTFVDLSDGEGGLLDEGQIQRWMGLAIAYRNDRLFIRAMKAERISKQIRFCRNAIDKLHKAYRMCLSEKCENKNISDLEMGSFHFFSDPFSLNISLNLQPCLDSLFSLRDYIFSFLFEEMYEIPTSISQAASLLDGDDRFDISVLVKPSISFTEPYGIIARAATYRNAFFHYLGSSAGPLAEVYCIASVETSLGKIPRVIYPLDDNFERVRSIVKGQFTGYGSREEHDQEARRFMSLENHVDALDLVFDCYLNF